MAQVPQFGHPWSSVKNHVRMNNTTFKLHDVNRLIESIKRVNSDLWKDFMKHVVGEEEKLINIRTGY